MARLCQPETTSIQQKDLRHFPKLLLLDPRAIALFRVAIALCALDEWRVAFVTRDAFLQDDGMLSRGQHVAMYEKNIDIQTLGINLWLAAGSAETVLILLIVQFLVTISLLVGYYTWLSTVVVFMFINAWNLRLANKSGGGLEVIIIMLLWGIVLPLGKRYSLDAIIRARHEVKTCNNGSETAPLLEKLANLVASFRYCIISAGIPLHLAVMYYSCGVGKVTEHWKSGNAVILTVNKGNATKQPFASIMASLPLLCWVLAHATYYLETYGGFLLLVPSERVRLMILSLLIPFHLGMHLSLDIGMFQTAMISALLLLIPPRGCDHLEAGLQAMWSRILVLFTGSQEKGAVMLQSVWRSALSLGVLLSALLGASVALGITILVTNDLCAHLTHFSGGAYSCPRYGRPRPASAHRWLAFLGPPQGHTPYYWVNTFKEYFHVVGIVKSDTTADNGQNCTSDSAEKAVAIFTDQTSSQLNFNDWMEWSPDQEPHINQRWRKFFDYPPAYQKHSPLFADYICRKWNHKAENPKLLSLATLRVWEDMSFPGGSLVFSPRRYKYQSHFRCSDNGQSGIVYDDPESISNAMDERNIIRYQEIVVKNTAHFPARVYWIMQKTGEAIEKGFIREKGTWTQKAEKGHIFRFYWDLPGISQNLRDTKTLAGEYTVGTFDGTFTLSEFKLESKIFVKNTARYPLLVYWVYNGSESQRGYIEKYGDWQQTAKVGHTFRFYWDIPQARRGSNTSKLLLAQEVTVQAQNKDVVIVENIF